MQTNDYLYYFGILAVMIAFILIVFFLLRKLTQKKGNATAQHNDIFNGKTNSLFIQEVLPIDQKTKMIIIGRDNLRHVILLGENHSNLIETVKPEMVNPELVNNEPTFESELATLTANQFVPEPHSDPSFNHISTEKMDNNPALNDDLNDNDDQPSGRNITDKISVKNIIDEKNKIESND